MTESEMHDRNRDATGDDLPLRTGFDPADLDLDEDFTVDPDAEADADDADGLSGEFDDDVEAERSTLALFDGDTGGLSLPQRKAMVVLMKQRFVSAAQRPNEWRVIREDPAPFKSRLNDMFLDLHIDYTNEVAFKRQVLSESGGRDFPTLVTDTAYSREETILLVFLRHRFQSEQNAGHEVVTVDRDDLASHVKSFRPAHDMNFSGGGTAVKNAIDSLLRAGVLIKTNDSARLRISPVIGALLPVAKLHELWETLAGANQSGTATEQSPASGAEPLDADAEDDDADGSDGALTPRDAIEEQDMLQ